MGWDRMGWDRMGWDGIGWDGIGYGMGIAAGVHTPVTSTHPSQTAVKAVCNIWVCWTWRGEARRGEGGSARAER